MNRVLSPAWAGIMAVLASMVLIPPEVSAQAGGTKDDGKLRIIVFGAHPDDCEIKAGGVAAKWTTLGHHVKLVSVTNGDIGHWKTAGGPLAERRKLEVMNADKMLGVETEVLDNHDGELLPTLENRKTIVRLIREWKADIVLCPRSNDYHPDHRYTAILVQDAAFMVTVPFFCPDIPHLTRNPVFLYVSDGFQKPNPFQPDVVVSTDDVIERKVRGLVDMESQFVERGVSGSEEQMWKTEADHQKLRKQVGDSFTRRCEGEANRFRSKLVELYGEEKGKAVRTAEAFEICEYGRRPGAEELKKLFPFF
ncbi:MAG: PIG-L deacetylase family protein [Candidatus Latescibacterota bacterium]